MHIITLFISGLVIPVHDLQSNLHFDRKKETNEIRCSQYRQPAKWAMISSRAAVLRYCMWPATRNSNADKRVHLKRRNGWSASSRQTFYARLNIDLYDGWRLPVSLFWTSPSPYSIYICERAWDGASVWQEHLHEIFIVSEIYIFRIKILMLVESSILSVVFLFFSVASGCGCGRGANARNNRSGFYPGVLFDLSQNARNRDQFEWRLLDMRQQHRMMKRKKVFKHS